jgi:hypothetical protein
MAENENEGQDQLDEQARAQTGQRQIQVRLDERNRTTSYANAFRTNGTAEEVIVDFGLNTFAPNPQAQTEGQPLGQMTFDVSERVIMNYMTAKRLAINLGQVVRRYEEQFGELKLNAEERKQQPAGT